MGWVAGFLGFRAGHDDLERADPHFPKHQPQPPMPAGQAAGHCNDNGRLYRPGPRAEAQSGPPRGEQRVMEEAAPAGPVAAQHAGRARASVPARGSWSPPVLEPAGPVFEPKPSIASSYRPDCVADGWSTPDFTVRAASVRGYDHRFSGAPRQDDLAVGHHRRTGAVVFAVADGVSAAPLSHIGATAACRAALSAMVAGLDSADGRVDWQGLVRTAAWQICEQAKLVLGLPEVDAEIADEQMATTLVAGLVVPAPTGLEVSLIQVGDSSAWRLRGEAYHDLLNPKHNPDAAVASSAVTALPRVPPVSPRTGTLAADDVLLVGTDGFGDALGTGRGVVGRHFAHVLAEPPPILKFANDLDFSKDTFDDDRTLFALWPRRRS